MWVEEFEGYDSNAPCPDTDGDNTPDIFDDDNDGDGVSDKMDISPNLHGNQTFSKDNLFKLKIDNLEVGQPVYVDLQIRPTNPDNSWRNVRGTL